MSLNRRPPPPSDDQPALPLDVETAIPAPPRPRRTRAASTRDKSAQLAFDIPLADEEESDTTDEPWGVVREECPWTKPGAGSAPLTADREAVALGRYGPDDTPAGPLPSAGGAVMPADEEANGFDREPPELDHEPAGFDPDPFADIPGFEPAAAAGGEFVLLPASLRSRFDPREFARFLASLKSVVRDWEGAPETDDGGIRLTGPDGGAWVYPEARRVRLVTDGAITGAVAEDLVALCRWLDSRAGMRLYPAGEISGAGVDRSLDPSETFLGG